MYKVTKRDCPMFGIGPYVCEFICDTASDISTLPTSISEGTGGKTVYDNQKCASGSMAIVADNGAESKQYMLNNQDIWCPYSVAAGSSESVLEEAKAYTDSEIADLINGAPTTRDTLKEISDAMAENQTVVEALDAAIGSKADKTDIPTSLPANGGNADTVDGLHANGFIKVNSYDGYDCNTLYDAGLYLCGGTATNTPNNLKYGSLFVMPYRKPYGNEGPDYCAQIFIPNGDASDASMWYRTSLQNTWNEWKRTCDNDDYALKSKYGDTTINVGRKADTTIGTSSTAEGVGTTASGTGTHAEGVNTTASGSYCHAEGGSTTASGTYSHAEGYYTSSSQYTSHAEGGRTTASQSYTHAEGFHTIASNLCSHAGGKYNANMSTTGTLNNTLGTAFVIGNGIGETALSNAFSVMFDGTVKAKSTITASTTADYAEFFEWLDGNLDGEDRVGYFVTMEGNKIRIANPDDEYILGIVSGEPFVLGNGDCDTWNGMFLRDEFRRTIYEPAPKMEEILDDDGNPTGEFEEIEGVFEGIRPKLNPEYDHTQPYISRLDRSEWAPIGMLGVLAVRHDGTAKVNGYVTVAEGGIAKACDKNTENSYRVIKSNSDTVVEIIFR